MWPNNFELQNSATAILFSRCNWEKLTPSMTPTCTFNWHKVWFSHGHTNIAGTKQVYLTVFAGFLHPSSNYSQRIYNQWSAVALFIRSNIFLKKRSNHGSLLFNVHSTIKTNKKIWSIMKISKNWHFRILDLSPCYASRPKTTLLSSFFPHIDSPSSPPPPPPLSTDKN